MNQETFEKIRVPLAVFLIVVIFIAFNYRIFKRPPSPVGGSQTLTQNTNKESDSTTSYKKLSSPSSVSSETDETTDKNLNYEKESFGNSETISKDYKNLPEQFFTFENSHAKIVFSSKGGVIVTNVLKKSKNNSKSVQLEEGNMNRHHTGLILSGEDLNPDASPLPFKVVHKSEKEIVFEGPVRTPNGYLMIRKKWTISGRKLILSVSHNGKSPKTLTVSLGSSLGPVLPEIKKTRFNAVNASYGLGEKNKIMAKDTDRKETIKTQKVFDWIAIDNRFFLKILKPHSRALKAVFMTIPDKEKTFTPAGLSVSFQPQQTVSFDYIFLPKNRKLLTKLYKEENKNYNTVFRQFSLFKLLSGMIYPVIMFFYNITGNMGIAIILMTLLLKIVTFPLQQKSMVSMQKMSAFSPKIQAIQNQYKDNKQKAQEQILSLYKKEKINPLSGCIPMLIPIPVFIALFSLFRDMNELSFQSFLWISDLSAPDTVMVLPFKIPFLGLENSDKTALNVLPLLMALITFVQSALQPKQPSTNENQQTQMQMMKYFMPVMLLFIAWKMPSGLVLYWTVQTLFSAIHTVFVQKMIKKEMT